MNKHILLICEAHQFGIVVAGLSAVKIVKRVVTDLATKEFICLTDYVVNNSPNPMYVKSSKVIAVMVGEEGNIQVPNQKIFVPGKPN